MKRRVDAAWLVSSLLCLAPIIVSAIFYARLPAEVAVHWDGNGAANGFAPRWMAAFGIPVFLFFVNLLVHASLGADPRKKNVSKVLAAIGKWAAPLASVLCEAVILIRALGRPVNFSLYFSLLLGVYLIAMGNYLPKCRQNYTVGIKLPWTLASEENWNKTHRMTGIVWMAAGLAWMAQAFLPLTWAPPVLILLLAGFPLVYSYCLHKRGV